MAHHLWGTSWLESLASNRDAVAESRVAAIDELADKRFISRKPLIPLLWIEQPFDVRHEAALMFLKGVRRRVRKNGAQLLALVTRRTTYSRRTPFAGREQLHRSALGEEQKRLPRPIE
jgi:hypothetical protein